MIFPLNTDYRSKLVVLLTQRSLSDETAHTEELMSGDNINEKIIDQGWTAQIEETKQEISQIQTWIADYVLTLQAPNKSQGELNLE